MSRLLFIIALTGFLLSQAFGQNNHSLSGRVADALDNPLTGASVVLHPINKGAITNPEGEYIINGIESGIYMLEISFLGYKDLIDTIIINNNMVYNVRLVSSHITLQEVVVVDHHAEKLKREESLNIESLNNQFIRQYQAGSLMKTLERVPGVNTIDIGAGQSKPVIRGLGFNRVVVVDNGIKHEGQQWGADHGLEIDQYAINSIDVVKGPASLMYGSDAIGGAIVLKSNGLPLNNAISGTIDLMGKTNNKLLGTSVYISGRKNSFFGGIRANITDYADYRVPADSIDIYSYKAALHKNRLRNTAGKEQNLHLDLGFIHQRFNSRLFLSNLHTRSGFFANAHGLEPRNVDTDLHDKSNRDILYPRHEVSHLKAISKNQWLGAEVGLDLDLGFQHNFRQEWSPYVNHGWMPPIFPEYLSFPEEMEREFGKFTYSGNLKITHSQNEKRDVSFGLNAEYQDNKIDGRGFIIPAFTQGMAGGYLYAKQKLSAVSIVNLGIRYDMGQINTNAYTDWFPSPNEDESEWDYIQRAAEINRTFSALSWSVGYNYNLPRLSLKANLGKSFRMPGAKELAANGVNYHHFSYEVGNPDLAHESSYQFDMGAELNTGRFVASVNPFVNYFSNYIYLNPTHLHDRRYGNGNQIFNYSEAEVLRIGGEMHAHFKLTGNLKLGLIGEYIYSEQLSGPKKGFSLPFSPAPSALISLKYQNNDIGFAKNAYIYSDYRIAFAQHHIVPPEEVTGGYRLLNLGLGGEVKTVKISFQVNNLFNSKHFNHSSYYRLINVPEPGRNFTVSLSKPFIIKAFKGI